MKRIILGIAAVLLAITALSTCEIMAMSPFPMTVALADRMVKIKSIMHGYDSYDTRLHILKNGQYIALVEGKDHLTIFDRDLNLKYQDSTPALYSGNLAVVDTGTGEFYIGLRRLDAAFTTPQTTAFATEWFYYYSPGAYYAMRMTGGSIELSNGPVIGALGAGAMYAAPPGWELNRVQTDVTNGKVSLIFRESGSSNNIPHILVMNLADAIAGLNPFTVGIQRGLESTETDKTFMVRGGFVSHAYNNAKAFNLDLSDRKTAFETAMSKMALGYSPDSDRFYAYDKDSGYLYRCKPWW